MEGQQRGGFAAGESLPSHHLQQLPVNLPLLLPHRLQGKDTEKPPVKTLGFTDPQGFPPNSGDPMKAVLRKPPQNWDLGLEKRRNLVFKPSSAPALPDPGGFPGISPFPAPSPPRPCSGSAAGPSWGCGGSRRGSGPASAGKRLRGGRIFPQKRWNSRWKEGKTPRVCCKSHKRV